MVYKNKNFIKQSISLIFAFCAFGCSLNASSASSSLAPYHSLSSNNGYERVEGNAIMSANPRDSISQIVENTNFSRGMMEMSNRSSNYAEVLSRIESAETPNMQGALDRRLRANIQEIQPLPPINHAAFISSYDTLAERIGYRTPIILPHYRSFTPISMMEPDQENIGGGCYYRTFESVSFIPRRYRDAAVQTEADQSDNLVEINQSRSLFSCLCVYLSGRSHREYR